MGRGTRSPQSRPVVANHGSCAEPTLARVPGSFAVSFVYPFPHKERRRGVGWKLRPIVSSTSSRAHVPEHPRPDAWRGGDSWRSGGALFAQDYRGKRSVCLDLTSAEGRGVLEHLVGLPAR